MQQWTPEVRYVDVDANTFPEEAFDCVVLLGVLEYLQTPERAFAFAQSRATSMVVSYCHPATSDFRLRDEMGWINSFSMEEFLELAAKSNWRIARSDTFKLSAQTRQSVYLLLQIG